MKPSPAPVTGFSSSSRTHAPTRLDEARHSPSATSFGSHDHQAFTSRSPALLADSHYRTSLTAPPSRSTLHVIFRRRRCHQEGR